MPGDSSCKKIYKVDVERVEDIEEILYRKPALTVIEEDGPDCGDGPGLPGKGKGGPKACKDPASVKEVHYRDCKDSLVVVVGIELVGKQAAKAGYDDRKYRNDIGLAGKAVLYLINEHYGDKRDRKRQEDVLIIGIKVRARNEQVEGMFGCKGHDHKTEQVFWPAFCVEETFRKKEAEYWKGKASYAAAGMVDLLVSHDGIVIERDYITSELVPENKGCMVDEHADTGDDLQGRAGEDLKF